ncbi:ATP-binding cassette subfamily G member 4, partial [Pseudolycoriella hygida]
LTSTKNNSLKYLPRWPAVDIEFQDLSYSVPDLSGNKNILRGISGNFKSSQLTAILGPSGAGKSTLLNVLAGFKTNEAYGNVLINGKPRNMKAFRKMSRYIMQVDLHQPHLTVHEAMMVSADLKLGNDLTESEKNEVIDEILDLLRLTKTSQTMCQRLSGGEMKRLSIALELVNNPPVIFLDEPTTGLDDLSSSQCISLLRRIALGGRTIICSIHTPSAKIFQMFDLVYAMAGGQCVYQGNGSDIVPYLQTVGLSCPVTHNPADFSEPRNSRQNDNFLIFHLVVEVSCGEYGMDYIDRMVNAVENGKCFWTPLLAIQSVLDKLEGKASEAIQKFEEEIDPKQLQCRSTSWGQFKVLFNRRWKQMWRDSCYMKLKIYLTLCMALLVGGLYQGCGNDATKALFNFGFCFTVIIAFMYNPLMPVLLQFPSEIDLLRREHFNRWFKLGPYYWALLLGRLPIQVGLCVMYLTITYPMSGQPLEWRRILMFYSIAIMIAMISESLGYLLASRLSLINGMFVGPVTTVPLMLLAVYGIGYKNDEIPAYVK